MQKLREPPVQIKDITHSPPSSSHYKPNTFCTTCTAFLSRLSVILNESDDRIRSTVSEELPYHQSAEDLLYYADQKCHLCSLLLGTSWLSGHCSFFEARKQILNSYAAQHPPLKIRVYGHEPLSRPEFSNSYSTAPDAAVLSLDIGIGAGAMVSVIPTEANALCHWRGTVISVPSSERQPLCNTTGDTESLELARYWLSKCRKEHEECLRASASAVKVRPARLLRLDGTAADPKVRLVTLEESVEVPEYLALSYSWGPNSANSTRLLVSNIYSFSTIGIPFQILPATIQDAVTTTLTLGFQFLWIDALCIIQDSPSGADWKAEAGKMGAIYRNAACTIAALGCRGNHQHLFRPRNPLCDRPCQIPGTGGRWQISNTALYFFREYESYGLSAAPLHTRAWVVQERISSVRTLFFGESGLFWECTQTVASDSDPDGLLDPPQVNFKHNLHEVLQPQKEFVKRYIAFRNLWPRVLEQYTLCNLTYQTDKLVAIKGIIELVGEAMGWTNCMGLWVNVLKLDMAWKSNVASATELETGGRAGNGVPSWSWANVRQSVTSAVDFGKYSQTKSNPFGPNVVGYPNPGGVPTVEVEGLPRTVAAALEVRPHDSISLMTDLRKVWIIHAKRTWSRTALLTVKEPSEKQIWKEIETHGNRQGKEGDGVVEEWEWTPDIPLDKSLTTAWFMNLLDFESKDGKKTGIVGLVLKEVDYPRRVFERIGILKKTVFKSEELSNEVAYDENGKLVTSKRNLPPNPFAMSNGIIRLVHII
jgi:hypothetical protein